ncbi:hypothetical protein Nepgr_033669 [Nepenthes gracilis]|uniref:Uncharacterized protein n=1 Tax=Nepenthes gracilis TaxID=150966 RepID=A0AAD3TLK9_NEPGR|nr:hypothetical protein Nepgr_033669 [Nepenthes gracilis]
MGDANSSMGRVSVINLLKNNKGIGGCCGWTGNSPRGTESLHFRHHGYPNEDDSLIQEVTTPCSHYKKTENEGAAGSSPQIEEGVKRMSSKSCHESWRKTRRESSADKENNGGENDLRGVCKEYARKRTITLDKVMEEKPDEQSQRGPPEGSQQWLVDQWKEDREGWSEALGG